MRTQLGFNLIEMAIVLLIVSLLISSLLPTLSIQRDARYRQQAKEKLEEIKEALLGYAIVYGELPCPAIPNSKGEEKRVAGIGTACKERHGFVPVINLGLSGVFNDEHLLIDPWGNPYRYSISNASQISSSPEPDYCSPIEAHEVHALVSKALILEHRFECIESTITIYDHIDKKTTDVIANKIPVVLYSLGEESGEAYSSEENENLGHTLSGYAVSDDEEFTSSRKKDFNHILTWISPHILYNRMVSSGTY